MSPDPPMLPFLGANPPGLRGKEVISLDDEITEWRRLALGPEAAEPPPLPGIFCWGTMSPPRGTLYSGPEVGI